VRGRAGSVGVGYAGLSQMQTLVTRLGRARWVWAYCCYPLDALSGGARSWRQSVRLRGTHAGTGGSFGGRAKAQSDGVASGQWAGCG
jgi:hypothetical protein